MDGCAAQLGSDGGPEGSWVADRQIDTCGWWVTCGVQEYLEIKQMMFKEPELLHSMLKILADNIGEYANFQIESGAQVGEGL